MITFKKINFLLILSLLLACTSKPEHKTHVLKKQDLIQRVSVAGLVVPARKSIISAPYTGYIQKIHVHVGSDVQAGDPLVTMTQTPKGTSESPFPVRATFSGKVVQILRAENEFIEASKESSAILRVDDMSHMYVEADIPEIEIEKVKIGMKAEVKSSALGEKMVEGRVKMIFLAAKESRDWSSRGTVQFPIRVELIEPTGSGVKNSQPRFRPGMSALIDVIIDEKKSILVIPHEFIWKKSDEYFVDRSGGERVKVKIGAQNEEFFEVISGLKEGDIVNQVDFSRVMNEAVGTIK